MSTKSKAAVLTGKEKIEIKEFPLPKIGNNDGLLRVEACGVCGFDSEAYLFGGNGVHQLPCVIGHEIVGRVDNIGAEASERWSLKTGDRIVVEEYIPCGLCDACLTGNYQQCFDLRYGSMREDHPQTALWGGFSEYMYLHPRSIVHKVDPNVSAELLQLFIPISNGIHWVQEVGKSKVGDTVVIQGPGPMGLGAVIGAKEAGAGKIIVTGLQKDEHRLQIAKDFGADHIFTADTQDIVNEVSEVTNGKMADTVINAATAPQQFVTALDLAGRLGTVVHSGTDYNLSPEFISSKITWKLLTIKGVLGRPKETVGVALRLIESGKYALWKMITHSYSIEEAGKAVHKHAYGEDDCIHVAVVNNNK
ncbi:alcohol dehydrogenase catalytic domain-containing protein [Salicibibacter cibarius]|uniref:Alcohol dehydrogenase catalytic domain-containing protein n=1 Tax=Salicibibacter cibarius TaxID=2743000 RepID=A0A7T6Z0L7_9BACI|nr:alcohol dehydrogenase catalytic domain-containing protein [Salicibibacter cibarius]QQK74709.1 alcohol dehydrogenase catalytic domain-containing protein [Salicibibacter cibarius]